MKLSQEPVVMEYSQGVVSMSSWLLHNTTMGCALKLTWWRLWYPTHGLFYNRVCELQYITTYENAAWGTDYFVIFRICVSLSNGWYTPYTSWLIVLLLIDTECKHEKSTVVAVVTAVEFYLKLSKFCSTRSWIISFLPLKGCVLSTCYNLSWRVRIPQYW